MPKGIKIARFFPGYALTWSGGKFIRLWKGVPGRWVECEVYALPSKPSSILVVRTMAHIIRMQSSPACA